MALSDYYVKRDHFRVGADRSIRSEFAFPCMVCVYNNLPETLEPCSKCDHNINAKPNQPTEENDDGI